MKLDISSSLKGKTALVSGGISGIGKVTVDLLLEYGVNVAFTTRDNLDSCSLVGDFLAKGPHHLSAHKMDLSEPRTIRDCFKEVLNKWGNIDILVNNAAVGSATVEDFGADLQAQDTFMFLINADGTLKMCQEFSSLPCNSKFSQRKIINISSVGGGIQIFPNFRLSDGMSKSAVAHLTKQLAAEYMHEAVDVFSICPGATNTAMFQKSTLNKMSKLKREEFLTRLPKRRLIEPIEIANIIVFLASEYSSVLNGAVIDASMGLGVRPGSLTEFNDH